VVSPTSGSPSNTPSASAPQRASGAPRSQPTVSRGATIDPVRVLQQNWKKIIWWTIGGAVFAVVFQFGAQYLYPLYSGQVILRLRPQLGEATEIFGENATQEETVARLAQTEAQQMVMRDVLVKAISSKDVLKTSWHEYYLDDNGQFVVDEAVDDLEDEISSGHRRGTQFFALYWKAHVAGDVPVVLNAITTTYLDMLNAESDRKFNGIKQVFVKKQNELDQQIDSMKAAIRRFITEEGIPAFEENAQQSQRGLEELQKLIAETTMDLSLVKSQRGQLDSKLQGRLEPSKDDIQKAEMDPALMQLNRDLNDLTIQLQSKNARFGPQHPEVRYAEETLASARAQKDKALDEIVQRDLNGQFKSVTDRQGGLEDLLKKQTGDFELERKRIEELASRVAELEAMKERQKRLEEERGVVAKTVGELDLARSREDSVPVEVAQRALTPRELFFPNWKVVLPGVWVLVILVGVGLIFLKEFMDQRVRFASELAALASGRVLGVIPDRRDDPTAPARVSFVVRESPQSALAESLRQVSTNLIKNLADQGGSVVGVFSALPGAGATAIITNLASSALVIGKRVLVVDANFRRPGLCTAFGLPEGGLGLGDVLAGTNTLADVVQRAAIGADVVGAGRSHMIELLDTLRMTEVMGAMREQYDLVLIDTAPMALAAESMAVANRVDGSMLVVRAMRDQRGLIGRLIGQLTAQRGRFIGAVLNRPEQTAGGYYRKNAEMASKYAAETPTEATIPTPASGAT